ncbi:MAG TPA: hypothetical protein PK358_18325 [Spirochaetota bacterium]|nr:hypothetical protein [Spirochaetota bacterium]
MLIFNPRSLFSFIVLLTLFLLSCKSVHHIPENLDFNPDKHSHIRTMQLHMLFIDKVNGKQLNYSRMKRIYDIKTVPGMITLDVIYSGGSGPEGQNTGKRVEPGWHHYWVYKRQEKRISFKALPGRAHFIQYIAHPKGPMTVWQDSHDYISHLRDKPVYKKDLSANRTMTVSRIIKGPLPQIKERFLNELILQEYLQKLIGGWSIRLMFQPKGNIITANLSGIGESELDNEVIGHFKFQRAGRGNTRVTMYAKKNYNEIYPNYLKQVFIRFDPEYRKNVLN